jgi:hypothetical protein
MSSLTRSRSLLAGLATGAVLLALAGGPARARAVCAPIPAQKLAPYLTAPCNGATVRRRHAVVFTAVDPDPQSSAHAPYLDLQTTRTLVDGHLTLNRNGDGIFGQMTVVAGRARTWSFTAARQIYPSWWDNRPGTYYVQVEQVDPRVASGILYGPITTVRVR